MGLSLLPSVADSRNLFPWAEFIKTSSATPNAVLPFVAAPQYTPLVISSITQAANVATATTAANHGLNTGDKVNISNAAQGTYNGLQTVTVTGATTFTYAVTGSPTSPATLLALGTGNINFTSRLNPTWNQGTISSLTQAAGLAAATTSAAHGLNTGDRVSINNAAQADYNGLHDPITVTGPTTFTFPVNNNPTSPATVATAYAFLYTIPQFLAGRCLLRAPAANTAAISFGPTSAANYGSIPANTEYLIYNPQQTAFDLSTWYFASASASQQLNIIYV